MSEYILLPCAACSRHLRSSESLCVFCGAAVSARARVTQPAAPKGASRAAVFAVHAALLASAGTACSSSHSRAADGGGKPQAGGPSLAQAGAAASAPHAGSASTAGSPGTSHAAGAPQAGAIASRQPDAGALAAEDAGFMPVPLYGGAFPDPKTRARI
jgi:hypothetical protein